MTLLSFAPLSSSRAWRNLLLRLGTVLVAGVLSACGGSADAPPPPEPGPGVPAAVPPTITQQPASLSVTAGQAASFTVAAAGTAPLSYRWQRNGIDIAGATTTTYTLQSSAAGDSGAVLRAIATNIAGSATSNNATLTVTVTVAAPVLTITPQPANASALAGATASFTVGGICSTGTLNIQWQRRLDLEAAFADVSGATATTYSFVTAATDNGTEVRANLSCSGQSAATSRAATLTVTAPAGVTLSVYPLSGLRDQARITGVTSIDQLADGSYALIVGNQLKRLSADRLSITSVAGGQTGYADGPAASAQFRTPGGIAHDASGVLYIADTQNHVIRRVAVDGTVSTLAGSAGQNANTDGTGSAARFNEPQGIVLGPDGDLYVADKSNQVIRRVTTAGVVTTYAGNGTAGFVNGAAASAQFRQPTALAVAANGDLIVSDSVNQRVRRILRAGNAAGVVSTLAGSGAFTNPGLDGAGSSASIPNPQSLVLQGNTVYVRDGGGLIRAIDLTTQIVSTFTGSRTLGEGYADGAPGAARLRSFNSGLTAGSAGGLMAADDIGLRSIDAAGNVSTIASRNAFETDAGTGVLAQLPFSSGAIAVDNQGRIASYDTISAAVRRVDASGNVTLAAGLTGGYGGVVDGTGSAAQFSDRGISIAAGAANVLFVGDSYVVRRIGADNAVTTIAGSTATFGGANGTGPAALFNRVFSLAVAANGDVFVADAGNAAIRRVTPAGVVTTYAGVIGQSSRVDGPVATARLRSPVKVTVTPDGTLWFADGVRGSQELRRVSPDGSIVSSIGSSPGSGIYALASDAAGIVYYMIAADLVLPGGLYAFDPATGTSRRLIVAAVDQQVRLGSVNPTLPVVKSIAVLGPNRLLVSGSGGQLLLVTLP